MYVLHFNTSLIHHLIAKYSVYFMISLFAFACDIALLLLYFCRFIGQL